MNTLSRIDVRMEAARIAMQLKDASTENVIRTARKLEAYIMGEAELPEVGTDYYKSLLDGFSASINKQNKDFIGDLKKGGEEIK